MITIIVEGEGEEFALPILFDKGHEQQLLPELPDILYLVVRPT